MFDLEDLPLYKEDWLGLASLDNQQKLHKFSIDLHAILHDFIWSPEAAVY